MSPTKPRHGCAHQGCPELVESGLSFCDKHKKEQAQRYDKERGSSTERGYGGRWQRYRKIYLRENPICVRCGTLASVVDHIKAVTDRNDPQFWEPSNHQGLCQSCHGKKTVEGDGRWR